MTSLVLDLLVLAAMALFALLGWRKGLVLTLCGVVAVFVAYFSAAYVSETFGDSVAGLIQPAIQNRLDLVVEQTMPDEAEPSHAPLLPAPDSEKKEDPADASLEQVMAALRRSSLLTGMYESVAQAVTDGLIQVVTTATAAIAHYLACQISRTGLFFLTFFLVVIVWSLLSRALDLACRLSVLRSFNEIGGLLLGLLKGVFLLLAVVGLVTLLGLIPEDVSARTVLYRHFMNFQLPGAIFS